LKNVVFTVAVASVFALGLYSLFLASANAGKERPTSVAGLLRTAVPADTEKIERALGVMSEHDLVYVVLSAAKNGPDPDVEAAARKAALALLDSGINVSVRFLDSGDPDFTTVVEQNGVGRFPAVLAVKKSGGIVLVTDKINEKNLLHAYQSVWGKTSSCDDAKSAVY
jgi:hypothetical protein